MYIFIINIVLILSVYYDIVHHSIRNNKCVIINSNKRWLCSELSETKIDKNYNYKYDIEMLPKEIQNELKEFGERFSVNSRF